MEKETEYEVIISSDYSEFISCITYRINNGWKLEGGVSHDGNIYYQAITKNYKLKS